MQLFEDYYHLNLIKKVIIFLFIIAPFQLFSQSIDIKIISSFNSYVILHSDVLSGAIIGSGCAWLTYEVNKKLSSGKQ